MRKDLHGYRIDDAIQEVEHIVGIARNSGDTIHAEFVTGHGQIRSAVWQVLEQYDLEPRHVFGNTGVIVCEVM